LNMEQTDKQKEETINLSEQGYSETATKAIRQWYNPTKKAHIKPA
jgi:hypothetical protein